jgi:hypothetical protein
MFMTKGKPGLRAVDKFPAAPQTSLMSGITEQIISSA